MVERTSKTPAPKLRIEISKDCWGSFSYFGFINDRQYTESFDTIEELIEAYNEFNDVNVVVKNNNI